MEEVVKIYMERDGMKREEAVSNYMEVKDLIYGVLHRGGNLSEVEEILYDEGLEVDYLFCFI